MRQSLFLLVLAGLSACSGAPQWARPSTTPETERQDFLECEAEARSMTRQDENIDADILATRSQDWQRSGTLGMKRDTIALQNRGRSDDIVALCMRQKGYLPGEAP